LPTLMSCSMLILLTPTTCIRSLLTLYYTAYDMLILSSTIW
jgi:hypothetical protein